MNVEVRIDVKGRKYFFVSSSDPASSFRSATFFPPAEDPEEGRFWGVYVWWQKFSFSAEGNLVRRTWCTRYIFDTTYRMPFNCPPGAIRIVSQAFDLVVPPFYPVLDSDQSIIY